jgi:hypothetical protein
MDRYGVQLQEDLTQPVIHHGDCVGADEAAHITAQDTRWDIVIHPGVDKDGGTPYGAGLANGLPKCVVRIHEPAPYLQRNMDIVTLTSILLAMPDGPEKKRSGTWSTVRAALKMGRPVVVFPPDGIAYTIGFENHEH